MSNLSVLGAFILFLIVIAVLQRLSDVMKRQQSSELASHESYHFTESGIEQISPDDNYSNKTIGESLLSTQVYDEKMKMEESVVQEWDETHPDDTIWQPEYKMKASEFHDIAAPYKKESQNKDFLFQDAESDEEALWDFRKRKKNTTTSKPLPDNWSSPDYLRQAIILKEILDPPVCKRRNKH